MDHTVALLGKLPDHSMSSREAFYLIFGCLLSSVSLVSPYTSNELIVYRYTAGSAVSTTDVTTTTAPPTSPSAVPGQVTVTATMTVTVTTSTATSLRGKISTSSRALVISLGLMIFLLVTWIERCVQIYRLWELFFDKHPPISQNLSLC